MAVLIYAQKPGEHPLGWCETDHPRDDTGKFVDKEGAYWRIHSKQFTGADLHDNHASRVWLDQDDENTRHGLSVAKTIDGLVDYFAGHKGGGSSPGRGATFQGAHLVQVEGDETGDTPYEWDYGERLITPRRILSSTPIENTPFVDLLKKRIDEIWGNDCGSHEYEFNGNGFDRIQRGTLGWTQGERDALDSSSMTPDEFREILTHGPSHEYWDSIEQMQFLYPDELASIKSRLGLSG